MCGTKFLLEYIKLSASNIKRCEFYKFQVCDSKFFLNFNKHLGSIIIIIRNGGSGGDIFRAANMFAAFIEEPCPHSEQMGQLLSRFALQISSLDNDFRFTATTCESFAYEFYLIIISSSVGASVLLFPCVHMSTTTFLWRDCFR